MKTKVLTILLVCVSLASATPAASVNKVYWTRWNVNEGVCRANVDGSGAEQIVSAEFNSLDGLAIDPVENKLYIGTSYHLLRCNLDGSDLETVISGGEPFNFFCLEIDTANRKIYWSDWIQGGPTPGMRRANLDGTSIETLFEGSVVKDKAIDTEAGKLYWNSGSIYKSNLDGSNRVEILVNTFGQGHLAGLALDVQSNKMYFTTWEGGGIWRANMDGTNVEHLLDDKTTTIALDTDGGKLYWTSWAYSMDEIRRANLDGSDEEVVCSMGGKGNAIALEIVPEPTLAVAVDIKPGSCPNPLNVNSKGVLPIAVLGTEGLDVTSIDPTSIRLTGVEPLRSGYEDVATPVSDSTDCNCTTEGPDGFLDLTLKFKTQDIVATLGEVDHGDVLELQLDGVLYDQTPIEGTDCVVIRGKHKPFNKADINKDGVVNIFDFIIMAENWLR